MPKKKIVLVMASTIQYKNAIFAKLKKLKGFPQTAFEIPPNSVTKTELVKFRQNYLWTNNTALKIKQFRVQAFNKNKQPIKELLHRPQYIPGCFFIRL